MTDSVNRKANILFGFEVGKVFETNSINGRGWDGKYGGSDQPSGVYIYMIQVAFANGVTECYQGNVTMLR